MLIVLLGNCGNWNIFMICRKSLESTTKPSPSSPGGETGEETFSSKDQMLNQFQTSNPLVSQNTSKGPRWQEGTMMGFSTQSVWLSGENLQNAKSESDSIALLTNLCSIADTFPSTRQDTTLVKIKTKKSIFKTESRRTSLCFPPTLVWCNWRFGFLKHAL